MKTQTHIPVSAYKSGGFIGRYQKLIRETVIPHQYKVLCDKAEDTEKSHVIKNFINAGKALRNQDTEDGFYGMVFQDSDAAKWIEAAAYSLAVNPDAELENTVDGLIDIIADAQDSDGYLNTFFTVKDKDKRWTNLLEGHELYATGTTGTLIMGETGLKITRMKSGPLGGDQQIGSMVAEGKLDLIIFLRDPLTSQPHEPDVSALLRLCDVQSIPLATNCKSAEIMLDALKSKIF